MKTILRLEEAAEAAFALVVFAYLPYAWWWLPALFLLPDLSMLGYLAGPRVGALCYNLAHHKALALAVGAVGWFLYLDLLLLAGTVLFFHSAFDRVLGYGLKYASGFRDTHLGALPGPTRATRPTPA
ncbi:MAG: DUF4260 domain-containing protein [Hymenobacteraceae bacterium]|nr:DUF4260 domain-containing protein [Hymenobacteraceae bacterium]